MAKRSAPRARPAAPGPTLDDRIGALEAGWKAERPDLDLGLTRLLWRIEQAHYFHERRMEKIGRAHV